MQTNAKRHPCWQDVPRRLRRPPLGEDLKVDVAVVGAGITGLTTALKLRQAGLSTAVLEMHRIGGGATGFTTAHATAVLDRSFKTLTSKFGEEGARLAVQASLEAIDRIESTAQVHGIGCDFRRLPGYRYGEEPSDAVELEVEVEIASRLGLAASFVRDVPLPAKSVGAMKVEHQARFHPMRYLDGLAAALESQGPCIYEHTKVLEIDDGAPCRVKVGDRTVEARAVVLATHTPINVVLGIHTRVAPYTTYAAAFRGDFPVEDALFWDMKDPYRYIRWTEDEHGRLLIVGGADHKTGQETDTEARFQAVYEFARARFGASQPEYEWSHEVFEPVDGLPYIGRRVGKANVYLASGFAGNGTTFGTIAGSILSDLILGRASPYADLFSPARVKPIAGAVEFVRENANVAGRLVGDRLKAFERDGFADLVPGEGRLMTVDGKKRAVYCDGGGGIHVMSAVCTHFGCIVQWNGSESTWDCPCHGSRFRPTGEVLAGPAVKGLEPERAKPASAEAPGEV
ncbi:MAG TPA: FAD-dependent oxidoreductase [Planctomycetota bacterium]|nr:FAD-dependent oxidoreductase [Planctomycetota bacterium]